MPHPAFLLAALLLTAAAPALAADGSTPSVSPGHVEKVFLVPASDGYGVGECLTGGPSECGQVIANAWCESQGFAMAASYGLASADDYTGAIETGPRSASERPIRIACQD